MKNLVLLFCLPGLLLGADLETLPAPKLELEKTDKSPFWAATLSSVFPGLGHMYLGEMETAFGLTGTGMVTLSLALTPEAPARTESLIAFQLTSFYSAYAAYRDARIYNGVSRYSYKMPTDSLWDLSTAPVRWKVMKKPEVWGGLLGALALAVGAGYCHHKFVGEARVPPFASSLSPSPVVALPIGIGEEAFFHGYLQTQFSELYSPRTGIAASGLIFGAAHIPNAKFLPKEERWGYYAFSLPLITALGFYNGWLMDKNHSLQEAVAIHTWYDFALFSLAAFAEDEAASLGAPTVALSLPF